MKDILREIFNENEQKCTDLFGAEIFCGKLQDVSRVKAKVYINYIKFAQEIMKRYKIVTEENDFGVKYEAPCPPSRLPAQEQQDVKEMLEAIIDIVHYAKYKGVKKHE